MTFVIIARCAAVCVAVADELRSAKSNAPKKQYDRQTPRRYDFGIHIANRIHDRILALDGAVVEQPVNGDKLAKAIAFAASMRPVIQGAKASSWRQEKLQQLDELLN